MQDPSDNYLIGRRWGWLLVGRCLLSAWVHHESKHPGCAHATNKRVICCKRNRLACFPTQTGKLRTVLHNQNSSVIPSGISPNGSQSQHMHPVLTLPCNPQETQSWIELCSAGFFLHLDAVSSHVAIAWPALNSRMSHLDGSFTFWSTLLLFWNGDYLQWVLEQAAILLQDHLYLHKHSGGRENVWKWTRVLRIQFLPLRVKHLRENQLMMGKSPQNTTNVTAAFSNSHVY